MIAAGWAMKPGQATARDFLWAELPLMPLDAEAQVFAQDLVQAADGVASGLRRALPVLVAEGSARDAQVEHLWATTEADFSAALAALSEEGRDQDAIALGFLKALGRQALEQFDALALPGLSEGRLERAREIVAARRILATLVHGRSKQGQKLWDGLGVAPSDRTAKTQEKVKV